MDRTANFYAQPTYVRGGGIPIYSGSRRQRGGNVLGAIKSFFMPLLGMVARKGASAAVNLAKNVAGDVFRGRNIRSSLKNRGVSAAKSVGKDVLSNVIQQITSGPNRAPPPRKTASRKRKSTTKARQSAKRVKTNF